MLAAAAAAVAVVCLCAVLNEQINCLASFAIHFRPSCLLPMRPRALAGAPPHPPQPLPLLLLAAALVVALPSASTSGVGMTFCRDISGKEEIIASACGPPPLVVSTSSGAAPADRLHAGLMSPTALPLRARPYIRTPHAALFTFNFCMQLVTRRQFPWLRPLRLRQLLCTSGKALCALARAAFRPTTRTNTRACCSVYIYAHLYTLHMLTHA